MCSAHSPMCLSVGKRRHVRSMASVCSYRRTLDHRMTRLYGYDSRHSTRFVGRSHACRHAGVFAYVCVCVCKTSVAVPVSRQCLSVGAPIRTGPCWRLAGGLERTAYATDRRRARLCTPKGLCKTIKPCFAHSSSTAPGVRHPLFAGVCAQLRSSQSCRATNH